MIKKVLVIIMLVGGTLPCWSTAEISEYEKIKIQDKVKEHLSFFYMIKNHDDQIQYLDRNWRHWVSDIQDLKHLISMDADNSNKKQSKLRSQTLKVLTNTLFISRLLSSQSLPTKVLHKVAVILRDFVKHKTVRSYILNNQSLFNIHDILSNTRMLYTQFVIIDIIKNLLKEKKNSVELVDILVDTLLNNANKQIEQPITFFISKELKSEYLLSRVLDRLFYALDSDEYVKRFRAVVAIGNILHDHFNFQHFQQNIDMDNKQIIKILDKLILMLSAKGEVVWDVRKQVIFTLGHLNGIYPPAIKALIEKSKMNGAEHTKIRAMSIKALTDLPTDGMPILKELKDILTNDDEELIKAKILKLLVTKLPFDNDVHRLVIQALNDKPIRSSAIAGIEILLKNDQVAEKDKDRFIEALKTAKLSSNSESHKDILIRHNIDSIINDFNIRQTKDNSKECVVAW